MRAVPSAALSIGLILTAGCQTDVAVPPPEPPPTLFQAKEPGLLLRMTQADAERYLVSGVYGLEAESWRWTAKRAVVRLPMGPVAGLKLVMKFAVPEPVVARNGPVRLSVQVNDHPVEELRYSRDGHYDFEKPVPAERLKAYADNFVSIEIDKPLPKDVAGRELGFILVYVGLQPLTWKP